MDAYLPLILQALGGVVGGNIVAGLTRGGGGVWGRTLAGLLGGLAAGQGAVYVEQAQPVVAAVSGLIEGPNGQHLGNLIVGAMGGGVLGLIAGLVVRPRG